MYLVAKVGASLSNINIGTKTKTLDIGRKLDAFTGVVVHAGQDASGNEITYSAGDSTGYVLEVNNPIGTQEMADSVLAGLKMRGYRYQPYEADGAMLNPAAEIGDGITIDGTVSVIHAKKTKHSRLMAAEVSAPFDEEVNHEYTFEPRTQREFKRESAYTRSRLTIAEDSIEAKVSKESPTGQQSFSWKLLSDSHTWYANGTEVMRVTKDGLKVTGEIVATSGVIGGCRIVNGVLQVDSASITNINADTITAGTLNVARIAAGSITGGTGGKIAGSTITTANTVSGINTNLGYGAAYGLATQSGTSAYPANFTTGYLRVTSGISMTENGVSKVFTPKTVTISGTTITYLGA